MFTTDQSHLRRYLTTLGVAIAAGTLSLAGLFLKLQQDLIVTQPTLARLTPTARATLLKRQDYLSFGTAILPWFVLVGFFGGIGLAAYGMIGWARRQKVIDEREDIGLRKERVELRQLTDTERSNKLDREARESVEEPSMTSPSPSSTSLTDVRTEIAILENALVQKLRTIYSPRDVLASAVTYSHDGAAVEVDAVVNPAGNDTVVFEIKYASNSDSRAIANRVFDGFQQLMRATSNLASGKVNPTGVLVVVLSDDATSEEIERWNAQARQSVSEHTSIRGSYVGRYSDFLSLDATDFAALVGLEDVDE
jgi:hypothetical protein